MKADPGLGGPSSSQARPLTGSDDDSGAVDVDKDLALAHPKDDSFVGFGAGIPLTVDHAPGDEPEVARPALDALGAARAEKALQLARTNGWTVVSINRDWATCSDQLGDRSRVQVPVVGVAVGWGGWPRNSIRAKATSSSPASRRITLPVGWPRTPGRARPA